MYKRQAYSCYIKATGANIWYLYDNYFLLPVCITEKIKIKQGLYVSELVQIGNIKMCIRDRYKISMKKAKRIFFQNQENLDFFYKKRIGSETQYYLLPVSYTHLDKIRYNIIERI